MNNFLKVFNNELKKVKEEHNPVKKQSQVSKSYLERIEKDMDEITDFYRPIIEEIKNKFGADADVRNSSTASYKADDNIAVTYKGSNVISYQLQKEKVEADEPAAYRIKVDGSLQLPDILIQVNDNGHYYYFEDKHTSRQDNDKDDLVGIPYQDKDGVVESNQFDKIIEKHVARLARYIGNDN